MLVKISDCLMTGGHVNGVFLNDSTHNFTQVKVIYTPQTRFSGQPCNLGVLLTQEGDIKTAECTCVTSVFHANHSWGGGFTD